MWELMFYKFELGYNAVEAMKNICCAKSKGTVTIWFKKFQSISRNLENQARSSRFKSVDSKVLLPAIDANPTNSTQSV